jgi:ATP synthase protein I
MTEPGPDGPLERAVEKHRERRDKWKREGERPLSRNLALVGLGWLIVIPALLGALLGHVIDAHAGTGVSFTFALILGGVGLGSWFAWTHVRRS